MFIHRLCYFQTEGIRCFGNLAHASPDLICGTGLPGASRGFSSSANILQDERAGADQSCSSGPCCCPSTLSMTPVSVMSVHMKMLWLLQVTAGVQTKVTGHVGLLPPPSLSPQANELPPGWI